MIKIFAVVAGTMIVATPLSGRSWRVGKSTVNRIYDKEANVACYVIPENHCMGDCAYSPAISCVKLDD